MFRSCFLNVISILTSNELAQLQLPITMGYGDVKIQELVVTIIMGCGDITIQELVVTIIMG